MNQDSTLKTRTFICTHCNLSLYDKSTLNKHYTRCKKNPSNKIIDLICDCGREFAKKKCFENHKLKCSVVEATQLKKIIGQPMNIANMHNCSNPVGTNNGNVNINPNVNIHIENYNKEIKPNEVDPKIIQNILESAPSNVNIAHYLIGELVKYTHFNNGTDLNMNKYKNIFRADMAENYNSYLCVSDNTWEKVDKNVTNESVHDNILFILMKYSITNDNCLEDYFVTGYGNKKYNLHEYILKIWNPQTPLDKVNAKASIDYVEKIMAGKRGIVKQNYETTNFKPLEEGQYVF